MVEYAEKECHDCLGVFPANQLKRKILSKQTGSSVRGVDLRVEGDLLNPARKRSYYRDVEIFLCCDCRRNRRIKAVKNFFGCLVLLVLVAVAGFAALVWWGSSRSENNINSFQLTSSSSNNGMEQATNVEELSAESSIEIIEPVPEGLTGEIGEEGDTSNTTLPLPEQQPTIAYDRLEGSVLEAVTAGTAVRWSADGMSGYVVPSDANEVGCRDYYFTDDDRADWRSATQRYCPKN
ncbi:MAG: hypothetical protein AAF127_07060 [Pseudomonadota bacterium]